MLEIIRDAREKERGIFNFFLREMIVKIGGKKKEKGKEEKKKNKRANTERNKIGGKIRKKETKE